MKLAWALAAAALIAAYATRPGATDFTNPDEPRAAEVAREMRLTRNPVTLQLNGAPYADKPPLLYWAIAMQGDVTETTARLPSILATLGLFAMTAIFLRTRFGDRAALMSVLILATSPLVLWLGRRVAFDPLLTFFTTASIFAFWKSTETNRWSAALLAGALSGLAFLTKGPPGLAFPALALAPLVFLRPRAILHALLAVVAGFAVIACWLAPAIVAGGEGFAWDTAMRMFFQRVSESGSHQRPWHLYLSSLATDFAPWVVLLPLALARVRRADPFAVVCASWLLLPLALFSCFETKRGLYLMPAYPAMAILIGVWLDRADLRAAIRVVPLLVAAAGVAVILAATGVGRVPGMELIPGAKASIVITGAAVCAAGLAGLFFDRVGGLTVTATGLLGAAVAFHQLVMPKVNEVNSAKPLASAMVRDAPPEARWVQVDVDDFGLVYYSNRPHEMVRPYAAPIEQAFRLPGVYYVVATERGLGEMRAALRGVEFEERFRDKIGRDRDLVVVALRRAKTAPAPRERGR